MVAISEKTLAAITFSILYESGLATHEDRVHGGKVNFWRDEFPARMRQELMGLSPGKEASFALSPRKVGGEYDPAKEESLPLDRFRRKMVDGEPVVPAFGRFFPKGLVSGLSGVYRDTMTPFRCTSVDDVAFTMNTNHPLVEVGRDLTYRAVVEDVWPKEIDGGGRLNDWLERVCHDGQGMQMRFRDRPTDFFVGNPFARRDEEPDTAFYAGVRITDHVDSACQARLAALYGDMLSPSMRVLDLMASVSSHLPSGLKPVKVTGLGLNREELAANPALDERVVHDLNASPELPFDDASFDAVICSLSVEYLARPMAIFREAARVLEKGGVFILTFSNRFFPTKAIRLWPQLHEFERMGLVLEFFDQSQSFTGLHTLSERGWPRPMDDEHFPMLREMDPLYAVWGHAV